MDRKYWNDIIGYNFRSTNICAAIRLAQLEQMDTFVNRKISIGNAYFEQLKDVPVDLHEAVGDVLHTKWMNSIIVHEVECTLKNAGIETRPTFYPVHTIPMYSEKYQRFPVDEYTGWEE